MWTESVYRDLLQVERSELGESAFRDRYVHRTAILVLDVVGFSRTCERLGEIRAFLDILNVQRVCEPVLRGCGASLIRAFADDLVALFQDPADALASALEIQRRMGEFNSSRPTEPAVQCCFGIGYGDVFDIGPNNAMGSEMNYTSKLGEDIAEADEILLTKSAYNAVSAKNAASGENTVTFAERYDEASGLSYFRAVPPTERGMI
jgi:class 3 adenylate cyclase